MYIELGFENKNYGKTSNNSILKESKSSIKNYMQLLEHITEKEIELKELYRKQKIMENDLLNNSAIRDLLHKVNENTPKQSIK